MRACNALGGDPDAGPAPLAPTLTELRRTVACDARGSALHLIAEGEHALDACIGDGLCLSGSPDSAALVADSIRTMLAWAGEPRPPTALAVDGSGAQAARDGAGVADDPGVGGADPASSGASGGASGDGSGGGGGSLWPPLLLLLLGAGVARSRRSAWPGGSRPHLVNDGVPPAQERPS